MKWKWKWWYYWSSSLTTTLEPLNHLTSLRRPSSSCSPSYRTEPSKPEVAIPPTEPLSSRTHLERSPPWAILSPWTHPWGHEPTMAWAQGLERSNRAGSRMARSGFRGSAWGSVTSVSLGSVARAVGGRSLQGEGYGYRRKGRRWWDGGRR